MKAALYARVSTDEQAQRENSIPAQLRALREYCKREHIEIYKEYTDEGISGQKLERPAFQDMLSAAYDGKFNLILVHKFDRFARKIEISRNIKTSLHKANVNIVSITEPIEDSPMGFFMEGLHELMAEYYVKNLSAEVKKGMNERALKGKHMGQMPYGYYCQNGNVYVNDEQAEVIKKIYNLYLSGYGYFKIAKWLNENKIPTYAGIVGGWQTFQVSKILKNPKYIGKNYWNNQYYEADFPSILDNSLFDKVNHRGIEMAKKHTYRGNNFAKYFLLELLYCGECGSPMRIKTESHNTQNNSYVCRSASLYRKECSFTKHFNAKKLELSIEDYISKVLNGVEIDLNIEEHKNIDTTDFKQKRLEKLTQELIRAKTAYIHGIFSLEEYAEIKSRNEREQNKIKFELEKQKNIHNNDYNRTKLLEKIKTAWNLYVKLETPNEKRELLKTFIKRINIYSDRIEVIFLV